LQNENTLKGDEFREFERRKCRGRDQKQSIETKKSEDKKVKKKKGNDINVS